MKTKAPRIASLPILAALIFWRAAPLFGTPIQIQPVSSVERTTDPSVPRTAEPREPLPKSWSRPLFSTTEAALAYGTQKSVEAVDGEQTPRLLGIILDGTSRVAVLRYRSSVLRLQEQATVGQWTLEKIEARAAHLRAGDKSQVLRVDR
jgi:hypothetical protein